MYFFYCIFASRKEIDARLWHYYIKIQEKIMNKYNAETFSITFLMSMSEILLSCYSFEYIGLAGFACLDLMVVDDIIEVDASQFGMWLLKIPLPAIMRASLSIFSCMRSLFLTCLGNC